jgi:hypothetical protein
MKITLTIAAIIFLLVNCSKENNTAKRTSSVSKSNAAFILDTIKIPLIDLGTNTFVGDTGGLYPGGKNLPSGTYALDLYKACKSIVPLDTFGRVNNNGRVLFISLGGSTCGHNMRQLKTQTEHNPLTNSKLILLNCCNGSGEASLNSIMNPNDPYWDHVTQLVQGSGGSYKQVQLIYLESDDSTIHSYWPGRANTVKKDLENCLRVFKQKFPNIKVVYVLGRTRTFGNLAQWNREPSPYYMGWGCKWAIEDQINGVPGTQYKGKNAVAPMLTWGWYEWADTFPRKTDGFYWLESETKDGLHATPEAQDTLATRFQNFLFTDKYASTWYGAQ